MTKRKKEAEIKRDIGYWLHKYGCEVYDEKESSSRPQWDGYFQVENVGRARKPDLIIGCRLTAEGRALNRMEVNYAAVEIKPGYRHNEIADGFSQILGYYADYCWGADYFVRPKKSHNRKRVDISVFALATGFSPKGFLYKEEEPFDRRRIEAREQRRLLYPITFSLSRLLGSQRTSILNNIVSLVEIPGAARRVRGGLRTRQEQTQVGVLTRDPVKGRGILLMTGESPFFWRLTGLKHG